MKTVCGHCSFNDGSVYTSLPPKVKCMLTGKFHFMSDLCEIDFTKIDDENGNWYVNKPIPDSEDIVEVVRCKDCKWKELCEKTLEYKGADGYCSKGVRKEKNE